FFQNLFVSILPHRGNSAARLLAHSLASLADSFYILPHLFPFVNTFFLFFLNFFVLDIWSHLHTRQPAKMYKITTIS
ncbi:MAG: hypothetical protein MR413_02440, partial [Clostridia bacterium]|nr:hypothetical protein [Clostridia bacterium]